MAQTVIGLDIGTWSVKAAILDSGLRRFTLDEFRQVRLELDASGNPVIARTSDAVEEALNGIRERGAIVTAVPGVRVFNRELELPFTDDKRIQSVLGFELEGAFPVPVEDLAYDYVVLDRTEEGSKLLCSAVPKTVLKTFVDELVEAQADPKIVCMDTLAAADLVEHFDAVSSSVTEIGEAVVLVDIGHTTTSLSVVRDGHPELVRTFKKGGLEVTRGLMKAYNWDYQTAETKKHEDVHLGASIASDADGAERVRMAEVAERALASILRDIRMTIHAYASRTGTKIGKVFLYGGTARLGGLKERLAAVLGLNVSSVKADAFPWMKAEVEATDTPIVPNAAALALRFRREGEGKAINFRQGELAYESDFKALRERGLWLSVILLLMVVAFLGRLVVQKSVLEDNDRQLVAALQTYTDATFGEQKSQVFGSKEPSFGDVLKKIQSPPRHAAEAVQPKQSALSVLHVIGKAVNEVNGMSKEADEPLEPKEGEEKTDEPQEIKFEIELTQVNLDAKKAIIHGRFKPFEALSAFKSSLKSESCFEIAEEPRISDVRRAGGLAKQFNMSLRLLCSDPKLENEKLKALKKNKSAGKSSSNSDKKDK